MKIIPVLVLFLVLCFRVAAYNEAVYGCPGSIVRMIDNTHAVSYCPEGSTMYISYLDIGPVTSSPQPMNVKKFRLDRHRYGYASDLRVHNGQIYLCGSYQNKGYLIHMKLADLVNALGSESISYDFDTVPEETAVKKMAVYTLDGEDYIAAICYKDSAQTPYLYRSFSVLHIKNFGQNFTYRLRNVSSSKLKLDDIVATDPYVALIGVEIAQYAASIWLCDKGDVTNSMMDNYYRFQMDQAEDLFSVQMAAWMKDDEIAVAYMGYDRSASVYTTRIRYYDLGASPMPQMINAQQFGLGEKGAPCDMTYMPVTKTLLLTQYQASDPEQYHIMYLDPLQTVPYTAVAIRDADGKCYAAIDCDRASTYYVAQCANTMFKDQTQSSATICTQDDQFQIKPIPRREPNAEVYPDDVAGYSHMDRMSMDLDVPSPFPPCPY